MRESYTINYKALKINLDHNFYGTFAEIGAGQEVARNFFKVGGASGTIAKAMSAYDMKFSDAIYGEESDGRYVSQSRLEKMLDNEWALIMERLQGEKYETKRYFVFANTVTTINYTKTSEGHGWLGVRFQARENGPINTVILHVRLLDSDATLQQSVLGDLGVNLVFACYQYSADPNQFVDSLMDNLPKNSLEIDLLSMVGEAFEGLDNRLLALVLVTKGYSKAACFLPTGEVVHSKDLIYKKDICVLRARFKPFTNLNQDMISGAQSQFSKDFDIDLSKILTLCEMTLNNLADSSPIDIQDFLDRTDIICKLGFPVIVSNFAEHHELTDFLKSCKPNRISIALGVMNLVHILNPNNYKNPTSELLQNFGKLFAHNVRIYAYPYHNLEKNKIWKATDIELPLAIQGLFRFVLDANQISDIEVFNSKNFEIISSDLIAEIQNNAQGWEAKVPPIVVDLIKEKCLFDYPCDITIKRKKTKPNLFQI